MKNKFINIFMLIIVSFSLIGCSAKNDSFSSNQSSDIVYTGMGEESKVDYELSDKATSSTNDTTVSNSNDTYGQKLIRTINVSSQTTEFNKATSLIEENISTYNGYIESSQLNSRNNELKSINYSIRIPFNNVDAFMNNLNSGKDISIVNKYENIQDVTLQYVDTSSRLKTLSIEEERLYEFLEKADSIEVIITIEQRLSDIRYEKEYNESLIRSLDNRINYSTITINLEEVKRVEDVNTSFSDEAKNGFMNSIYQLKENVLNVVLFLIINSIYIGIVLVSIVIINIIIKTKRKKKNKIISNQIEKNE